VDALGGAVLDVTAQRVEQAAGGRRGRQAEGMAELAVEVAATERGIVAIRESEAGGGDAVAKRAQDAGLADARLADEHDRGALVERFEQRIDDDLLGGWQPEVAVEDFLGERRVLEREVCEVGDHGQSSSDNLAGLYSLIATCDLHDVDPLAYLRDVLIRVDTRLASQIDELLPHRWAPPVRAAVAA
jgi:hypothetical protein